MENKILSPMIDIIFKILMGSEGSKEYLTDFLLAVLKLSPDEYEDITIANPFLLQEYKGDKLGIVDIRIKLKSGKIIHVELQVEPMPFMESRIIFYVSKLITEQMNERDQYDKIKRVISILITDHPLIKDSEKYHHHFGLYDLESKVLLTDILEIHTLEIPKAKKLFGSEGYAHDNQLLNWLKFFNVKTEEELNVLAQANPVMEKASLRLRELSADEKAWQLYEARLKEQRDNYAREQGAVKSAVMQTKYEFAKSLLRRNRPVDEIIEDTGLTHAEIESLRISV